MMKSKFKTVLISAGIVLAVLAAFAAIMIHGAWDYVSRCAHIKDRENIECTVGDTLSIDDLAEFSNYDTRMINGIFGAEGEISDDGQSIKIISGGGIAEVTVFATNENAPEGSSHDIKITVKGE